MAIVLIQTVSDEGLWQFSKEELEQTANYVNILPLVIVLRKSEWILQQKTVTKYAQTNKRMHTQCIRYPVIPNTRTATK